MREIKPTNCHYCGYLCAFNATVENGRVIEVVPDETRYPYSAKILAGCRRWRMNLPMLDSPDRVNYPMHRVGERGSGQFERVSWDEALDDISSRLASLKDQFGSQTLASMIGGPHTSFWPLHRFMNAFGSPNNMGIGQICWNPRIWMDVITFGWTVEADLRRNVTDLFIIWGTNPAQSDNSAFWQAIRGLRDWNIPLVVIDPRFTQVASLADIWVPIKPGTDIWFALGMINILISENLIDNEFVNTWCYGYKELAQNVLAYQPEICAKKCDIDVYKLYEVARLWGNAQAGALVSGRGIDQVGKNVAPTHRAICCLRALRGFVDKPGTCLIASTSDFIPEVQLEETFEHIDELNQVCLNTNITPLQSYEGISYIDSLTGKHGNHLPARYLASAHPDLVLRAMETGEPYPVKALIVQATNPLLTYADTNRVFNALMKLDLIVVLDYFMTSTAQIADYVLPSAQAFERPLFQAHGGVANMGYGGPAATVPYYERKGDYEIFRLLGLRLGQETVWPDETFEDALRTTLEPSGMSWEEFCKVGIYAGQNVPFAYRNKGFATQSGKIELYSLALEHFGLDPLPVPHEQISLCNAITRESGIHMQMITGARKQPYNASMYFNNAAFRRHSPLPVAEVSEATLTALQEIGISEGDTIELASDYGTAKFILRTAKMRDNLISVDYGWWHPEWPIGFPDFGGIWDSNINCLTSCSVENGEAAIGTWSYNAIDCVIRPATEPINELWPKEPQGLGINA